MGNAMTCIGDEMGAFLAAKQAEHEVWLKQHPEKRADVVRLRPLPTEIRGCYDLSEEVLQEHKAEIIEIEMEREECENCRDCTCCPHRNDNKYSRPTIDTADGAFTVRFQYCPAKQKLLEAEKVKRLLRNAQVPELFSGDTWNDYKLIPGQNTQAVGMAVACVKKDVSLYVYGKVGRGKTKLASIIANERIKAGRPVLFVSMSAYLSALKDSFARRSERQEHGGSSAAEIKGLVREAPFLILDDVGAEQVTDWSVSDLQEIVDYRYNHQLPLVITSNYSLAALQKRLAIKDEVQGERIADRLFAICHEHITQLTCGNFRHAG